MKYMLLIYGAEDCWTEEERKDCMLKSTEQLGGYYIIDVDNLDDTITIDERIPPAKKSTVEIRPIEVLPELNQAPNVKMESR